MTTKQKTVVAIFVAIVAPFVIAFIFHGKLFNYIGLPLCVVVGWVLSSWAWPRRQNK